MEQNQETNQPQPQSEPRPEYNAAPAATPKKPASKLPKILIAILVIALLAVGFGYLIWQNNAVQSDLKDARADLDTKTKQLQSLKESKDTSAVEEAPVVESDTDQIIDASTAYMVAQNGDKNWSVEIKKQEGDFAHVTTSAPNTAGSPALILKKISGKWTVLYPSQGGETEESQRLDKLHGVPESIKS